jgi:hypothetical protein
MNGGDLVERICASNQPLYYEGLTTTYHPPDMNANIELALILLPTSSRHRLARLSHTTRTPSLSLYMLIFHCWPRSHVLLFHFRARCPSRSMPRTSCMLRGLNLVTLVQRNPNVPTHVCRGRLVRSSDMVPSMITDIAVGAKGASE